MSRDMLILDSTILCKFTVMDSALCIALWCDLCSFDQLPLEPRTYIHKKLGCCDFHSGVVGWKQPMPRVYSHFPICSGTFVVCVLRLRTVTIITMTGERHGQTSHSAVNIQFKLQVRLTRVVPRPVKVGVPAEYRVYWVQKQCVE
jgi:hypothetical protein